MTPPNKPPPESVPPGRIDWRAGGATAPIVALVGGVVVGLVATRWSEPQLAETLVSVFEPVGSLWLKALQLLVLPLTVTILLSAIGRSGEARSGSIAATTAGWFVVLLAAGVAATILITPALLAMVPASDVVFQSLGAAEPTSQASTLSLGEWLANLAPGRLLQSAIQGDLFSLMIIAVVLAVALRFAPNSLSGPVLALAEQVTSWCLSVAGLLFRILPLAVFALMFTATVASGQAVLGGLTRYVVLLSLLMALATVALYPFTALFSKLPMKEFASGVRSVQVLAFSTRSSMACLPAMLITARKQLNLDPNVAEVTLPLAVASFKFNMAVSANFQLFFLLHVYGMDQPPAALALAIGALTLQSFATPGLPSGAIWTTTPIYLALGIPLEGIVLTNVVDTIPDLFKTVANVTGDMSIATIVSRRRRRLSAFDTSVTTPQQA